MLKRKGFTLIEVLVVVAIIGLLIGILTSSLVAARAEARRTACGARLSQVGKGMLSYMEQSRDRMPHASRVPSIDPDPLTKTIYFADVLKMHVKTGAVMQCPNDVAGAFDRDPPKSYFETEKSSYEYRVELAGLAPAEFHSKVLPPDPPGQTQTSSRRISPNTVYISKDYRNFHGSRKTAGRSNRSFQYLYIDGHVGDFEQY